MTTMNILKATKNYPKERIPFIFNNIDTQAIVNVLANDMTEAIGRAMRELQLSKKHRKR